MLAVILMLRMQMTGLICLARIEWPFGYMVTPIPQLIITKPEHVSSVTQEDIQASAQASIRS